MAHIEGPEEGDRDREVGRPGQPGSRQRGRPLSGWASGPRRAAGSPALRTHTHTRAQTRRWGGWASAAGRPGAGWGLHALPREAGRTMGASFGDATEGASLPAQSVSTAARGTRGPARTILTAAPLAARARDTAWSRRSARPARGGGGAAAAARSGRGHGRPAAHPGRAARRGLLGSGPARVRGSRGAARAPPSRRPRFRVAHAPFLGREEKLPSQLCGIRLPCRADVSRYKFKNCHWPGAARLFLSPPPPDSETRATKSR